MMRQLKQKTILPGFGLALGFTILYLSLLVLIPLSATFLKASSLSWQQFSHIATSHRALAPPLPRPSTFSLD
jgi:sulfate transport system permease protein